jgi:hypothetical protein
MNLVRVEAFLAGTIGSFGGTLLCSTIVLPYHMRELPNLYHWMQFFTLHRMSIFSNFLDDDNNEKKLNFLKN